MRVCKTGEEPNKDICCIGYGSGVVGWRSVCSFGRDRFTVAYRCPISNKKGRKKTLPQQVPVHGGTEPVSGITAYACCIPTLSAHRPQAHGHALVVRSSVSPRSICKRPYAWTQGCSHGKPSRVSRQCQRQTRYLQLCSLGQVGESIPVGTSKRAIRLSEDGWGKRRRWKGQGEGQGSRPVVVHSDEDIGQFCPGQTPGR